MDQVIESLVTVAEQVANAELPDDIVQAAKRHLVDAVGCAMAGYDEPSAAIARQVAATSQGRIPTTVFGDGSTAPAELAAFANGVMVRCLDLNDTYASAYGVGHPSDYIPAILAVAEESGASGKAILRGIVGAYEVFGRLTDATNYRVSGWDHVSNGVVASAVGAGLIWELPREQLASAIALAAVGNLALHQTRIGEVSMWKGCASANACRNGIFAARLARLGMTGPPQAFQGDSGVLAVAAREFQLEPLREGFEIWRLSGCHLKRYPAGFFSQSAIDAAIEINHRIKDPGTIVSLTLNTFPFGKAVMAGDIEKWNPTTRESADHSLPYLVATALVAGNVTIDSFTSRALHNPQVRRLLDILEVIEDPHSADVWPAKARNSLTVTLADGSTESCVVEDFRGHARNPMSDADISEKFLRGGVTNVLGEGGANAALEALWMIDRFSDLRQPLRQLSPVRGGVHA